MSPTLKMFAWLSLGLAFASALIILIDIIFRHRKKMAIMHAVWPITALYAGPIALLMYWHIGLRSAMSPREKQRMMAKMQHKKEQGRQQKDQQDSHPLQHERDRRRQLGSGHAGHRCPRPAGVRRN